MIYDKEFLRKLDQYHHHHTLAKVISLTMDEYPVEEITGKITGGSINIDGSSSVRRTCSLTLVADDVKINDYYWGLNTKFAAYVGLENHIDSKYPDIIWFKQGIFVISSFNCSLNTSQYTINIQGKDKSSYLNGEVGGVIPASWDFATIDQVVTNEKNETYYDATGYPIYENYRIPIKEIILEMVHEFSQEPFQNIIIKDLDDYGIELLEYQGKTPIYYLIPEHSDSGINSREIKDIDVDGNRECWLRKDHWENGERVIGEWTSGNGSEEGKIKIGNITTVSIEGTDFKYAYERLIDNLDLTGDALYSNQYLPAIVAFQDPATTPEDEFKTYTIAKITNTGEERVCGYRITDIIYPYDLIASPGETVTSVLDKLVNMLGNFEYFYDVDGRFIFQKKKTFTDVSYNNIINEHSIAPEVWAESSRYMSKYSYNFDYSNLISSIQNSPNLSNIKNDYTIWGKRSSGSGSEIPVHVRYAIDKKPMFYRTITIKTEENGVENGKVVYKTTDLSKTFVTKEGLEFLKDAVESEGKNNWIVVDWRELICQMATDYRAYYHSADFLVRIKNKNTVSLKTDIRDKETGDIVKQKEDTICFYPTGRTGYEQYYIDFEMPLSKGLIPPWRDLYNYEVAQKGKTVTGRYNINKEFMPDDDIPAYAKNETYKKGDLVTVTADGKKTVYKSLINNNKNNNPADVTKIAWIESPGNYTYDENGWNVQIKEFPESMEFWFDFLDNDGMDMERFSVHSIGLRSKAINDDKIKSIYFRETPNVIFWTSDERQKEIERNKQLLYIKPGYAYIHIPNSMADLFTISSRGRSCMDVVDDNIYSYTTANSSVTLNVIPIYYLTPNTIIYINDPTTGIVGEYIMTKYSIQLGLQSSMSITANETIKRVY